MSTPSQDGSLSRRNMLKTATVAAAMAAVPLESGAAELPAARRGRIKQSLIHWCYSQYWQPEQMAKVAKDLGCVSIELIDPQYWPIIKQAGLQIAIAGSHGFVEGMN